MNWLLISILPKNHAGPVEKLISDFFRMPKNVGAIDSLKHKSHITRRKLVLSCRYHRNGQIKILSLEACFPVLEKLKTTLFEDNTAYLASKVSLN